MMVTRRQRRLSSSAVVAASGQPDWVPEAGNIGYVGYTSGAHPSGLPATLYDIRPSTQAFDPGTEPWKTSNNYLFSTIPGYCGGVWIPSLRKWAAMGGGHASYCVPAFYAFDVATRAWEWLDTPLPTDGFSLVSGGLGDSAAADKAAMQAAYPSTQWDADEWEWIGGYSGWPSGFAQPGKVQPEPAHSYYGNVFVPGASVGNTNGIILKLYPGSGRQPECFAPSRHYFDLDDRLWKHTANFRANPSAAAGGSVYVGGSVDRVFSITNTSGGQWRTTVEVWNPATLSWGSATTTNSAFIELYSGGLLGHDAGGLLINCLPATSQTAYTEVARGGVTYTSANQHQFYVCNAAALKAGTTATWSKLAISNPGGTWPVRPTYGSNECGQITWTYCPANGCFYAINGNNGSTTLWKLSPPAGAASYADYRDGTWTISTETLASGIPCGGTGGATGSSLQSGGTGTLDVMNRLVWDDLWNCLLWFDCWYQSRPVSIKPTGV